MDLINIYRGDEESAERYALLVAEGLEVLLRESNLTKTKLPSSETTDSSRCSNCSRISGRVVGVLSELPSWSGRIVRLHWGFEPTIPSLAEVELAQSPGPVRRGD
ncbi:MAG: hypothetical protein U5K29_04065 [Acidimicrobiales bacterium]|nr:hypothetical protein [Acidimicrobiales bacterium]